MLGSYTPDFREEFTDRIRSRRDVRHFRKDPVEAAVLNRCLGANAQALQGYVDEKAKLYAGLKLSGMHEAPVHLAVYCDEKTAKGAGLGAQSMPETRAYSVVGAITLFWLAARAEGLGVGWISILDAPRLVQDMAAPPSWKSIGYLCVGWPEAVENAPELERVGCESRARALWLETR